MPAHVLYARHDADGLGLLLEHRALFDVRLEGGFDRLPRERGADGQACALQLVAHADPGTVGQGMRRVERQPPGPHRRAHHRHRKAAAFLVAPHRQFDRMHRLQAMIVQGFDDFETGEHSVHAIELASCRLGIEMAARHDGR